VANDTYPPLTRPIGLPSLVDASFELATAVQQVLERFVAAESAAMRALDPALKDLTDVAAAAVLAGGKRVRPLFAYWGWRGVVGPDAAVEPVLPALAALELLHAFALTHDDVMDRSATRRGHPTAHRALAGAHRRDGLLGDADRFGDSGAILTGDLCLVWADSLMRQAAPAAASWQLVLDRYDRMRIEAIAGQYLDVLGESMPSWPVDQAMRTARLKTASYTVVRPLQFGAALAGVADEHLTAAYADYGTAVGEAFQLNDDLLGVYGDTALTGKPVGDDLTAAKPTVLLQLARLLADPAQAAELAQLLEQPQPDVVRLGEVIRATGAAEQVGRLIDDRIRHAVAVLSTAQIDPAAATALAELAGAVARRAA
jgi:geranylgeranyl diphosphate synthase, type I